MKIVIEEVGTRFMAAVDGDRRRYFGNSENEALGKAIRGNIAKVPGLEIEMRPKSDEQKKFEERRRDATKAHGND